jgi:hypothetical protein
VYVAALSFPLSFCWIIRRLVESKALPVESLLRSSKLRIIAAGCTHRLEQRILTGSPTTALAFSSSPLGISKRELFSFLSQRPIAFTNWSIIFLTAKSDCAWLVLRYVDPTARRATRAARRRPKRRLFVSGRRRKTIPVFHGASVSAL